MFSDSLTGPGKGVAEFCYADIGDANLNIGFLGQACMDYLRNAAAHPGPSTYLMLALDLVGLARRGARESCAAISELSSKRWFGARPD